MNYDRVILELLDRVSSLEETVAQLKANTESNADEFCDATKMEHSYEQRDDLSISLNARDTTKYIFEGKRYGKSCFL